MKKLFNAIRNKAQSLAVRTQSFIQDVKGDLATNTIGAIIVAVVMQTEMNSSRASNFIRRS